MSDSPARIGRVAVLGAGSWGTALAVLLAQKGLAVSLWDYDEARAVQLQQSRRNPRYLPDVVLPPGLVVGSDAAAMLRGAEMLVLAIPSHTVRDVIGRLKPLIEPTAAVVSVAKGIENGSLLTVTQVLAEILGADARPRLSVLYGPSHAEEVAQEQPTTVVAAGYDPVTVSLVQEAFMTPKFRVYSNPDVLGVEVGGSVKNVLAIGTGICDGLGLGDNTKAALLTRGMVEMSRLGVAMGASARTFAGLSGIGDVIATCLSRHSRNRHVGEEIGKGRPLSDVLGEMVMVAEGVRTTRSVHDLARTYGVEMPISEQVYRVLFEGKQPRVAMGDLMTRDAKEEVFG